MLCACKITTIGGMSLETNLKILSLRTRFIINILSMHVFERWWQRIRDIVHEQLAKIVSNRNEAINLVTIYYCMLWQRQFYSN